MGKADHLADGFGELREAGTGGGADGNRNGRHGGYGRFFLRRESGGEILLIIDDNGGATRQSREPLPFFGGEGAAFIKDRQNEVALFQRAAAALHPDLFDGIIALPQAGGIGKAEGEIPQAMYDARMDEMVNDFAFRVEQQGLRLEDYLKYMGQTMEQFRASFMPQAEKQVKIGLALEAVAAAEHIEASEDEINAEIKRIADQYKMEEDKVRELVNVDDLKKDLAINKAIDFIKSHANIVEKAAEEEKAADAE